MNRRTFFILDNFDSFVYNLVDEFRGGGNGDMDTCILIRSAFVKDGVAVVQAGGGVVADSVPQNEADESRSKAAATLSAIAQAQGKIPA